MGTVQGQTPPQKQQLEGPQSITHELRQESRLFKLDDVRLAGRVRDSE